MPRSARHARMNVRSRWRRVPPTSKKTARTVLDLEKDRLPVSAIHGLERVTDLEERGVCAHALEHRLDDIGPVAGRIAQRRECALDRLFVAGRAQRGQALALLALRRVTDLQDVERRVVIALGKRVEPDDHALALLDLALLLL